MKCNELKPLIFSIADLAYIDEIHATKNFENPHDHAVYKATDVDSAIAEQKARIHELESMPHTDNSAVIERLSNENERLNKELTAWIQSAANRPIVISKLRDELRATKRFLWMARAERAKERQNYESGCRSDGWIRRENMWLEVERLCRHKAEEYK